MDTTKTPAFLANFSEANWEELAEFLENRIKPSLMSSIQSKLDPLIRELVSKSSRSEAVNLALANIMAKTGTSENDVLLLALTLYDLAVDAAEKGQRLVLLDRDYRFVREIVGLGLNKPETVLHESVAG